MSLIVRKPGILTTVQDLGRFGSRRFGINPNGTMDKAAVRAINVALGNDENAAVLEMHFPAPEIEFDLETAFGISGADFGAELDGGPIRNWSTAQAPKGTVLKFRKKALGSRAYLAVRNGLDIEPWLGSRSTNLLANAGGFGRQLAAGDVVQCRESRIDSPISIGPSFSAGYTAVPALRILPSGEYGLLTALSEQVFLSERFTLTNDSNRMGFRLKGPELHLVENKTLVSSAASFGTIQLLPDGQMIILMADHQTAGGYPRIGNIISADLPIAGQLGPGDRVTFKVVSVMEAENALAEFERELSFLKMGVRLKRDVHA